MSTSTSSGGMRLVHALRMRPRLLSAALLGLAVGLMLYFSHRMNGIISFIIAWNVGACLYLLLVGIMVVRSDAAQLQRRADNEDEGQFAILVLVVIAAAICIAAIVAELATAKSLTGVDRIAHIGLAVLTIASSWAFTHVMFALHYAHHYYQHSRRSSKAGDGGLSFPNDSAPSYGDFLYFAFVIGTSGQTADVSFTSKSMRRIGLVHCILAFIFNTTLLALTINIAASLLA